jgi:hypothetical protein
MIGLTKRGALLGISCWLCTTCAPPDQSRPSDTGVIVAEAARTTTSVSDTTLDGDQRPRAVHGDWALTKVLDSHGLVLDVPRSAALDLERRSQDGPELAFRVDSFPGCRYFCMMRATLRRLPSDTPFGTWVRQLTVPTSTDDDAEDYTPSVLDSMTVNGAPAYLVENFCGDCTDRSLYVKREGEIVEINWNVDDREPQDIADRLTAVARTLRWHRAAP